MSVKITTSRTMQVSLMGPTVAEMKQLIQGLSDGVRISVHYDKGYDQRDPGSVTFSVNEG